MQQSNVSIVFIYILERLMKVFEQIFKTKIIARLFPTRIYLQSSHSRNIFRKLFEARVNVNSWLDKEIEYFIIIHVVD